MPYDPKDTSSLPERVKSGLSDKKQRQWAHVWNNTHKRTGDEGRAFAAANAVTGLGKTFEHKAVSLTSFHPIDLAKAMDQAGQEGWELVSAMGNLVLFKRAIAVDAEELAKTSDEQTLAPPAHAQPTLDADVGNTRQETVFEGVATHPEVVPLNFWGLVPNAQAGEKRLEAKSSMSSGLKSPEHSHKCVLIVDKERNVLRGITDFYGNHAHFINKVGATDETEGHTHSYELLEERQPYGTEQY